MNPSFHSCVELRSSNDTSDSIQGNVINRANSAKRRWDKEEQNSTEFLQMQIQVSKNVRWLRQPGYKINLVTAIKYSFHEKYKKYFT